MANFFIEADYENSIIELFQNDLGYENAYGPDIERDFYSPLYEDVLVESLYHLNRGVSDDAIQEALYKLKNFENGELVQKNTVFMDYLQNGIPIRYLVNGEERSSIVAPLLRKFLLFSLLHHLAGVLFSIANKQAPSSKFRNKNHRCKSLFLQLAWFRRFYLHSPRPYSSR